MTDGGTGKDGKDSIREQVEIDTSVAHPARVYDYTGVRLLTGRLHQLRRPPRGSFRRPRTTREVASARLCLRR